MRVVFVSLFVATVLAAGEVPYGHKDFLPTPEHPVGWRGDGSGAFPGATPVTTWSEGEEVRETVKLKERGQIKESLTWTLKPGTPTRNIAWKTEMPSWSNGSPIVVGDRVFCMAEPHTLVCVDMGTGKILWQRENNPLALAGATPEAAKQGQELLDLCRMMQVLERWTDIDTRGAEGERKLGEKLEEYSARYRAVIAHCERWKPVVQQLDPGLVAGLDARIAAMQTALKGGKPKDAVSFTGEVQKKTGLPTIESWMGMVGWTFATPVSDGQRIYATIGQGQVVAYDLEGRRLWGACFKPKEKVSGRIRVQHVPSPLLAENVLVVQGYENLRGLDAATGRVLWEADDSVGGGYRCGSHRLVMVPDLGRVVATTSGKLWRLKDGKALGRLDAVVCGSESGGTSVVGQDDLVVYFTGGNTGGPTVCFRLKTQGADAVVGEKVWEFAGKNGGSSRIVHAGRLYNYVGTNQILDLASGKEIGRMPGGKDLPIDNWPSSIIAGRVFIGVNSSDGYSRTYVDGRVVVPYPTAEIGESGLAPVRKTNLLGDANKPRFPEMERLLPDLYTANYWHNYGIPPQFGSASPFAAGNRIVVRSISHLYCLGRAAQSSIQS